MKIPEATRLGIKVGDKIACGFNHGGTVTCEVTAILPKRIRVRRPDGVEVVRKVGGFVAAEKAA